MSASVTAIISLLLVTFFLLEGAVLPLASAVLTVAVGFLISRSAEHVWHAATLLGLLLLLTDLIPSPIRDLLLVAACVEALRLCRLPAKPHPRRLARLVTLVKACLRFQRSGSAHRTRISRTIDRVLVKQKAKTSPVQVTAPSFSLSPVLVIAQTTPVPLEKDKTLPVQVTAPSLSLSPVLVIAQTIPVPPPKKGADKSPVRPIGKAQPRFVVDPEASTREGEPEGTKEWLRADEGTGQGVARPIGRGGQQQQPPTREGGIRKRRRATRRRQRFDDLDPIVKARVIEELDGTALTLPDVTAPDTAPAAAAAAAPSTADTPSLPLSPPAVAAASRPPPPASPASVPLASPPPASPLATPPAPVSASAPVSQDTAQPPLDAVASVPDLAAGSLETELPLEDVVVAAPVPVPSFSATLLQDMAQLPLDAVAPIPDLAAFETQPPLDAAVVEPGTPRHLDVDASMHDASDIQLSPSYQAGPSPPVESFTEQPLDDVGVPDISLPDASELLVVVEEQPPQPAAPEQMPAPGLVEEVRENLGSVPPPPPSPSATPPPPPPPTSPPPDVVVVAAAAAAEVPGSVEPPADLPNPTVKPLFDTSDGAFTFSLPGPAFPSAAPASAAPSPSIPGITALLPGASNPAEPSASPGPDDEVPPGSVDAEEEYGDDGFDLFSAELEAAFEELYEGEDQDGSDVSSVDPDWFERYLAEDFTQGAVVVDDDGGIGNSEPVGGDESAAPAAAGGDDNNNNNNNAGEAGTGDEIGELGPETSMLEFDHVEFGQDVDLDDEDREDLSTLDPE